MADNEKRVATGRFSLCREPSPDGPLFTLHLEVENVDNGSEFFKETYCEEFVFQHAAGNCAFNATQLFAGMLKKDYDKRNGG